MIDQTSAIDPLVAEGPLQPMESLRPAVSLQRVLLLDEPSPMMVDLATGDVRAWENGPPVSVPVVSTEFDVFAYSHVQIQILRDQRPSSNNDVLVSLHNNADTVDVVETTSGELVVLANGVSMASGPIGASLAVVVTISPQPDDGKLTISARNAETLDGLECVVGILDEVTVLTVGGPSTSITGTHGRRRLVPVHVTTSRRGEPVRQARRAVAGAKRVAGAVRNRVR